MIRIGLVGQDNGIWSEENKLLEKDSFHFALITYGKCVYWVNHQKLIMERGDFILIPGANQYFGKSIPTVFHEKYVVDFRKSIGGSSLPILDCALYIKSRIGCYDLIHERIISLKNHWTEQLPYSDVMATALFMEILALVNRELDRGELPSEKHRTVELMKSHIQRNHRGKVTKEDVGEAIKKSPNYAATLFRNVTGQTISGYVHALRMKTAIYMLAESLLTIGEISEYIGYEDVSYFNRVFKRITGKTPTDYKV
ncbi:MAG: AraC family transcriptional regulator [Paenibacillaceae bacterium]